MNKWLKIFLFFTFWPYALWIDFKIAVKVVALPFRIIAKLLGKSGHAVTGATSDSISQIESHPKKFGLFLTVIFAVFLTTSNLSFNLGSLTSLGFTMLGVALGSAVPLFLFNLIRSARGGASAAVGSGLESAAFDRTADAAGQVGRNVAEKAAQGELAESGIGGIIKDSLGDIAGDIPFGDIGGAAEAEGAAAGAEGAVAAGGAALGPILAVILLYLLLHGFLIIFMIFMLSSFIGGILGSVGQAVGASGYGEMLGNTVGVETQLIPDLALGAKVQKAAKTAQCLGNAGCVKQWQANNTRRPGSEDRGERFSLNVGDYSVNGGQPVDVAYRSPNTIIPVDFRVSNPIDGLKGIKARNAFYRVKVKDPSGDVVCSTSEGEGDPGWIPLNGGFVDPEKIEGEGGVILPGSAASPRRDVQQLSYENCGILQPAAGTDMVVTTELKYEYSSQSTLQIQAMSMSHMDDTVETQEVDGSFTADTPVQTYIELENPMVFSDRGNGDRRPIPSEMRVGFDGGDEGIRYRVHAEEFEVFDSEKTVEVDGRCNGLKPAGDNKYVFSGEYQEEGPGMKNYFFRRQNLGNQWWEPGSGPPPASCSLKLKDNAEDISPTGETLTFRVDANYTVIMDGNTGYNDFKTTLTAENSICSQNNVQCPLLVPQSVKESRKGSLYSTCSAENAIVSTVNGCDVRMGKTDQDWTAPGDLPLNKKDKKIERGETAYLWKDSSNKDLLNRLPAGKGVEADLGFAEGEAVGVEKETIKNFNSGGEESYGALGFVESSSGKGDLEYHPVDAALCSDYSVSEFKEYWPDRSQFDAIPYIKVPVANCDSNDGWGDAVAEFLPGIDSKEQKYDKVKNGGENSDGCSGIVVVDRGDFTCWS